MSTFMPKEVAVTLSQSGSASTSTTFIDRRLVLSADNGKVTIGRTSKSICKGRIATDVNGLFDCAVMSRNHAVIYNKFGEVFIEDTQSMHGTFVNGTDIRGGAPHQLQTGDGVRFGIPISRGEESFSPVVIRVGIEKQERQMPMTFEVPDASESELEASECEDNDYDLDLTQTGTKCPQLVDLTSPVSSPEPLPRGGSSPVHAIGMDRFLTEPMTSIDQDIIDSSMGLELINARNAIAFALEYDDSVVLSDGDTDSELYDCDNNDEPMGLDEDTAHIVDSDIYSEELDPSVYDEVDSDYGSDFEDTENVQTPENTGLEEARNSNDDEKIENAQTAELDINNWLHRCGVTTDIIMPFITCSTPPSASVTATTEPVIHNQKNPDQEKNSRKRKANEISETSTQDAEWASNSAAGITVSGGCEESPTNEHAAISAETHSIRISHADLPRPSKRLRSFVANMGYATLGGITAAAVTFGSLAYTAPSF